MPNWCSNALYVRGNTDEAQNVIDSLLDGSIEDRTREMTYKLRKMLLAGLSGLLHPHTSTPPELLEAVGQLNPALVVSSRRNSLESLAYTEFLLELVDGVITPERYSHINRIYDKSNLGNVWYGDIPKPIRKKMAHMWRTCQYDFAGMFNRNIATWWSKPRVWQPEQTVSHFNIQLMHELPVCVMVNGFNGGLLSCSTEYGFNCDVIGIKWTTLDIEVIENGNWVFDTPWSPPIGLLDAIPKYVAKQLGAEPDSELVDITLYYYESGCAFQGINDEVFEYICDYDDESDEWTSNLLPEIELAFFG